MSTTATPLLTLAWADPTKNVKPDFPPAAALVTFIHKKDDLTTSLSLSRATIGDFKTKKDLNLKVAYRLSNSTSVTGGYDFGIGKYSLGATHDRKVSDRKTTFRTDYTDRDGKFKSEVSVVVGKLQKATVTFDDKTLATAKYQITKNGFIYEPSYNFLKDSPALSVQKQVKELKYKAAYDLKSEQLDLEISRLALKLALSTKVSLSSVSKPTVKAMYAKTYYL